MKQEIPSAVFIAIVVVVVALLGWFLLKRTAPPPPRIDPSNPLPGMVPQGATPAPGPGR